MRGGFGCQAATRLQLTSSWGGRSDWWGATRKIRGAHVVGFPATYVGTGWRSAKLLIAANGPPVLRLRASAWGRPSVMTNAGTSATPPARAASRWQGINGAMGQSSTPGT